MQGAHQLRAQPTAIREFARNRDIWPYENTCCRDYPDSWGQIRKGRGLKNFIKHFVRDAHGAWRCIEPATLDLPSGRVQVTPGSVFTKGTAFMNVDLAELLDREYFDPQGR